MAAMETAGRELLNATFGNLTVGSMPRVVGTITTLDALRHFKERFQGSCEIAEIRLDLIGEGSEWRGPARQIQEGGTPTLLTMRSTAEGGRSTLTPLQALSLAEGAWDGIAAIDVEHQQSEARRAAAAAQQKGKAVIASFHDFGGTPPRSHLTEIIESASAYADVVKISTFVHTADDFAALESLLKQPHQKPLCVIGMGPLGTPTRTDFPKLGSCLTYGYLDAPAAPGQISAAALMEKLGKSMQRS